MTNVSIPVQDFLNRTHFLSQVSEKEHHEIVDNLWFVMPNDVTEILDD